MKYSTSRTGTPLCLGGFTPLVDQQVAGLIMWIGGGTLYLVIILVLLARWLLREEGRRMASEPAG
jgi:cytochrome c oxidase assembly factor CtaG